MDESIVRHLEVTETPSTLKLSQAIRIGARLSPANDGSTFLCGGTCAVGAAYEAVFGLPSKHNEPAFEVVRRHFGISFLEWLSLGISLKYNQSRDRESIADWLESIGY